MDDSLAQAPIGREFGIWIRTNLANANECLNQYIGKVNWKYLYCLMEIRNSMHSVIGRFSLL